MQNKCLKDSSVLEGLAETQQSQYKPDVSQQVLGGECVRSGYEGAEKGLDSYNTDRATIQKGRSRLRKNLSTEGLMQPFFKAPPSFILQYLNRAPMRYAQHLACVKYIFFQNSAKPRAPETLKLFHKGKQDKVWDDFARKMWSIFRLTMIFKLLCPPQNQNTEAEFNAG